MTAAVTPYLAAIAAWLSRTPLSNFLGEQAWAIPAIQTVHILAVAVTLTAVAVVNLRILGVFDRRQPMDAVFARHLPWAAWAFPVLLATGLLMIAGEPARAPFRSVFWLKMGLIALAGLITWSLARALIDRARAPAWARAGAVAALLLWAGAAVAGRWIGYSLSWPGAPS